MAFVERWRPETSSFHLLHSEIPITLDEIACLPHLPIRGTILSHGRLTKKEVMGMLIEEMGVDPAVTLEEVERIRGAHVRFHTLQRIYDAELFATHQAAGDKAEANIHRERVLRCYLLCLTGTHLFVDTSSTYTDVV
ncbi:protein MAIN-LIKE 1-like [Vicia villosa]|uniref:protein MAIN-LIKE 1-like n=1 Tax=Vicia villosa TaxID=3911 RepID=UPI00273B1B85|nr:protein MAIN-LIKE 1-like [Vicia villosa]XP_058732662.1 protein MAIN-LIKE 1-like [Vicia villosa]